MYPQIHNRSDVSATGPRRRRALTVALCAIVAAALALPVSTLGAQSQDPVAPPVAAVTAAHWLAAQTASVPVDVVPGSPSWGATLDVALALVASGVGAGQVEAIWTKFSDQVDTAVLESGEVSPGTIGKAILLAHALGHDPRDVGEDGDDLVQTLLDTLDGFAGPSAVGLFGAADPTYDGAYRQGLALIALHTVGEPVPPTAVDWLRYQQCGTDPAGTDYAGAWMPYRADTSVPCAPDPTAFTAPDTNSTAMAVAALATVGGDPTAVQDGLDWLESVRLPAGGWENAAGWGMDPNSTALVMQTLVTVGVDDEDRFASAPTPTEALMTFFLGCDAPEADRGAFTYPGTENAPNLMASAPAVAALTGQGIVISGPDAPAAEPMDCSTPTPTSPTPTSAPAPAETPGPSAGAGTAPARPGRPIAFVG